MFVYDPPVQPYLEFIYRDNHILVLNKQAGLLTVPGKAAEHQDSLILRVQRVFPTARIVHRLDMATSGIILLALDKPTQGALGKQFEQRLVEKRYRAIVAGTVTADSGKVELPLRCDWPNRPKQMVCHQEGKQALTYYTTEQRYNDSTFASSEVVLTPVTGRSHQLRVHLQQLGHPILGDRLYGTTSSIAAAPRMLLHAEYIAFTHPHTGEALSFTVAANFPFGR